MAAHHKAVYDKLVSEFGADNVYVVTSNKTDNKKSPLNAKEKSMVMKKHGVKNIHVPKSNNVYFPEDLFSKFDPDTTVLVAVLGKKDIERLKRFSGALLKWNKTTAHPYTSTSEPMLYYKIAPHISINTPSGKPMSGTSVREFLGSKSIDPAKKKDGFKDIFGWYDKRVFDMLTKKFATVVESLEFVPIKAHGQLNEGGAYGHMMHPYEDMNITFGDVKSIINMALKGFIDLKNVPTEKTDGMNLMMTFTKDGVRYARTESDIKKGGMTSAQLKSKFANHISGVRDGFSFAVDDMENALSNLSSKQIDMIFMDGTAWANLEIIYPGNVNTISYDGAYIQFHALIRYDESGKAIGSNVAFASKLEGMIRQVDAHIQQTYAIKQPVFLDVKSVNFERSKGKYLSQLGKLQSEFGLKDSNTLADYSVRWWENFIAKDAIGSTIPNNILYPLVRRWALGDKSFRLTGKTIDDKEVLEWAKKIDSTIAKKAEDTVTKPFRMLILQLGAEVLKNASGFLSANPDKEVQRLKSQLTKVANQIQKSNDASKIEVLRKNLETLEAIGGLDYISPSEGLVFQYKGKTYKLTGAFAPVHGILGLMKF